jgi:FtsZ-binding cell division protein ZapB
LDRLERKIEAAAEILAGLREERDALRTEGDDLRRRLHERDGRVRELEAALDKSLNANEDVARLEKEKDGLIRERAITARRVQAILEKLEVLDLG